MPCAANSCRERERESRAETTKMHGPSTETGLHGVPVVVSTRACHTHPRGCPVDRSRNDTSARVRKLQHGLSGRRGYWRRFRRATQRRRGQRGGQGQAPGQGARVAPAAGHAERVHVLGRGRAGRLRHGPQPAPVRGPARRGGRPPLRAPFSCASARIARAGTWPTRPRPRPCAARARWRHRTGGKKEGQTIERAVLLARWAWAREDQTGHHCRHLLLLFTRQPPCSS